MIELNIEVKNEHGVHARPATKLAQLAGRYSSRIVIINNGVEADCKSVISVMMLAAGKGAIVTVKVDGEDEHDAMADIVQLFEDCFGEAS